MPNFYALPGPLDDESFEDDSLPPDRLEEETLAHRFAALRRAAAHRRWSCSVALRATLL